ncbi:MAG TPA: oligopeptide transporter, OPT family [Elusimicrobia bacterium]|nr:oligopeptide transporter, OPT family [Elusimicrobiota bacterium]
MEASGTKSLPDNAYEPLKEGEVYRPIIPAEADVPQAGARSVGWGLFFCVLFTIASAYSGLKVGQVMEAAIPISILAIGLARVYRRHSTLLENVIITGIGGVSGSVVAGAIFTLPALYSLGLDPHPLQTIFICLSGGCLGVLFLIPLRRYFVRETHGQFPYPEATAITEVLVTGEKGGSQAKLLLQATALAGVYDFFVTTFKVWKEFLDFQFLGTMKLLADKAKVVVRFDAVAFILGLGYVMGLRSSMILCAGGVLANFVLVPLIWFIGRAMPELAVYPAAKPIALMGASEIFRGYVRFIGVGAIATAGIVGILKSLRVVIGSLSIAVKAFQAGKESGVERTDQDISIMAILLGVVVATLATAVFFGTLGTSWLIALIGLALALVFSFFFTSVAANAIATTARNPVSGMTMLTIIVSSVVLLKFGLSGTTGMFFVMAIAGMVCTALSVSGQTITDLKTGYWLGSTPSVQEKVKFWGVLAAAIASGLTIVMLAKAGYYFGDAPAGTPESAVLAAPQASLMKALVEGFMNHQPIAYILFGAGACVTLVLEMLGVSSLVFALGMYLPLELNTPALVGGFLHHLVTGKSNRLGGEEGKGLRERGVVIASGLMAGGALGGVLGAAMRLVPGFKEEWIETPFYGTESVSQTVSLLLFLGLCFYVWFAANRKPVSTEAARAA